jgi:hypothetical protein
LDRFKTRNEKVPNRKVECLREWQVMTDVIEQLRVTVVDHIGKSNVSAAHSSAATSSMVSTPTSFDNS